MHKLLLWLPPEWAHWVAKAGLRVFQMVYFRILRRRYRPQVSIHLPQAPTLRFPARFGIAAGLDKGADFFAGLALLGAGFVEVGTVTPEPQSGNAKPRVWRPAPLTLVNHMGFNSKGVEAFRRSIVAYRKVTRPMPLLANIGKNRATPNEGALGDYARCLETLKDCVDGFVVNLSSPNTPGLMALQSESFLEGLTKILPPSIPVLVKLSPDLENSALEDLARYVQQNPRLEGLVLTNTSAQMTQEVFGWSQGGLSGRPLFSRALECVAVARAALGPKKWIIGVGGIWNLDTALQMRRAGADLVEVYTGFVYRGVSLLRELASLE